MRSHIPLKRRPEGLHVETRYGLKVKLVHESDSSLFYKITYFLFTVVTNSNNSIVFHH